MPPKTGGKMGGVFKPCPVGDLLHRKVGAKQRGGHRQAVFLQVLENGSASLLLKAAVEVIGMVGKVIRQRLVTDLLEIVHVKEIQQILHRF